MLASSGHGLNIFSDAINDLGVIVGRGPAGAVIGSGGTFQNVNNLIPAGSGFTLTSATGINNEGQIVADSSKNTTGQNHIPADTKLARPLVDIITAVRLQPPGRRTRVRPALSPLQPVRRNRRRTLIQRLWARIPPGRRAGRR